MTIHQDDQSGGDGGYRYATSPRPRAFGRKAGLGVVGLAAVLGTGAYLITGELLDRAGTTAARDAGALAPPSPTVIASTEVPASRPPSSAAARASTATSMPAAKTAATTVEPYSEQVRAQINAARAKATADGVPLQPAPVPKEGVVDVVESIRTEKTTEGTIRIGTAHGDLTGQGTRLIAADDGEPAGDGVRCTQNVRFSGKGAVRTMPTVLLCWRTSTTRSVVTLAAAREGRPSTATSLAVIDREWAKLG